jgi:ribose transport system substrate-binding protein
MKDFRTARSFAVAAVFALVVSACTAPGGGSPGGGASGGGGETSYAIGYSNGGGVGNGFREEQVCTAKAEALASGQVADLTTIHRNTDAAGQLSDIRDLIAAGVDAIVFNPNDPKALNPALAEAKEAGIVTVSVDAYVTDPDTFNLYNNQVKYAELGARWLFEQLGGKGTVYYMRGLAGHPADSDRDIGFKNVLKEYPDIKVVPNADGVFTGWDPATTTQLANDFIASGDYDQIDGIWTSGMDSQVVDAIKAANKKYVPIVGADLGAFVKQILDDEGYPGLLDPVLADNVSDEGKEMLSSWQVDGLDPLWPLGLQIEGWTSYTPEQAIACKGPGE